MPAPFFAGKHVHLAEAQCKIHPVKGFHAGKRLGDGVHFKKQGHDNFFAFFEPQGNEGSIPQVTAFASVAYFV
ncbi:hypothetical protein QW131_33650 [Roseibium salinum]|nr:hypothetical protein [Roseibium salinum]